MLQREEVAGKASTSNTDNMRDTASFSLHHVINDVIQFGKIVHCVIQVASSS